MIFTFSELFEAIIVSVFVAFITQDLFMPRGFYPLRYSRELQRIAFKNALLFVSPAIILHEFGHKLMALAFGYSATFHAAFLWLFLATLLKLAGFPFIIFVPAYVSTNATGIAEFFVAIAGPGVNLILFLLTPILARILPSRYWHYFAYINWFLFIFNMLPIPGFDGFHALVSLLSVLF